MLPVANRYFLVLIFKRISKKILYLIFTTNYIFFKFYRVPLFYIVKHDIRIKNGLVRNRLLFTGSKVSTKFWISIEVLLAKRLCFLGSVSDQTSVS